MRLDRIEDQEITLFCTHCGHAKAAQVDRLIERFGRATSLTGILVDAKCPQCGAQRIERAAAHIDV